MATRGTLITRILSELHLENGSFTSQVENALTSAVAYYQSERFWFSEGTTEFTVATASTITLSSDLPSAVILDTVEAVTASGRITLQPETWPDFSSHGTATAEPTSFCVQGQLLHLWPTNNQTRTIAVSWSGRYTMTASNSSSCVWTNEAEELIRLHIKVDLCENFLLDLPAADRYRGREGSVLDRLVEETIKRLGIGRNMKAML